MPIPQNIGSRLKAKGKDIAEATENAASTVASKFTESGKISVGGVASAVEGALDQVKGATLDMTNTVNGITGPALGQLDLAYGGLNQVLDYKMPPLMGGGSLVSAIGGGFQGFQFGGGFGKRNILESFASYNYVFTLGCLTNFELNFPDLTYRYRDPLITILRSGGGPLRGSRTVFERNGKTEYFIDDVNIETIVAPNPKTRQTNAVSISFQVTEPYSMGLFLQALQIAALSAGHKNYIEAPFVLSVDFKGFDSAGRQMNMTNARRIFPLKLVNVEFEVTEGGSQYAVEAIPFHEVALADQAQTTRNDATFHGRTVAEMLQWGFQSLTANLNNKELEQVKAKNKAKADQYVILFPTSQSSAEEAAAFAKQEEGGGSATTAGNGNPNELQIREFTEEELQRLYESANGVLNGGKTTAEFEAELKKLESDLGISVKRSDLGETIRTYADTEENINAIGMSPIVKSRLDAGKKPMGKAGDCEDEDTPGKIARCKVQPSEDARIMTVSSGKKIEDIIEEVVILSEFGRKIVDAEPDSNGMVDWFRVETNVYQVTDDSNIDKTGKPARINVYRVVPYKVHHSKFRSSTEPSKGIQQLKNISAREYNYIYTGQNTDIINFDINFNAAFFTAINGDYGQKTGDAKTAASTSKSAGNKPAVLGSSQEDTNTVNADPVGASPNAGNTKDAGGPMVHPESVVARNFNEALVNSPADLIGIDFTIWGDPFYIADSGMGNYSAAPATFNMTTDGTMNYQNGEVDIDINFRTPIDYAGSYMEFPGGGFAAVGQFSGVYQVLFVNNKFSNGQFTQELQTIRRPKQDSDTKQTPTAQTGAVSSDDPEKQLETTETNAEGGKTENAST